MKKTFPLIGSLSLIFCFAVTAMGQAGAPTQRVHIPGIPDATSMYLKGAIPGDRFVSIGCVSKTADGQFRITDWRGGAEKSVAGAPTSAATPPLVVALQGDQEMLNFQVGHEVQITGPVIEAAQGSRLTEIKVESVLYLSRSCWTRGTTTPETVHPKP
jgi:hypothetical protein